MSDCLSSRNSRVFPTWRDATRLDHFLWTVPAFFHHKENAMRIPRILLVSAVTLLLIGCQEGTPGGPGAKTNDSTTTSDPMVTSPEVTPPPATTESTPGTTPTEDSENSF